MKYTTTVADYLTWRGDIPFSVDPFNEVDNLVLCIVSYINFRRFPELLTRNPREAVLLSDICQKLTVEDEQLGLSQLSYIPVVQQAAQTERFAGTRMFAFEDRSDEEAQMQFAAVTFLLPDKSVFVAFRGTDTSLVGWKEDFNMSYLESVPAQVRAAEYTAEIMRLCRFHKVRIGGHSKGGNLAAWAGLHLPHRDYGRLLAVYNNDGPGFSRSMTERPEYALLKDKLHTFIPESSIVGVLLEHCEDYTVIASTARSIMQHEALSWCTERNRFIHLEERSAMGRRSDDVLRDWIGSMTPQERKDFTDAFFEILSMGGKARTLDDVQEMGLSGAVALVKEYAGADEKTRRILVETFKRLAVDIGEEVATSAQDGLKQATGFLRNLGRKKPAE
jgi:hypothetical protein